jgi:uncharacterized LabA/DUF88 family protein
MEKGQPQLQSREALLRFSNFLYNGFNSFSGEVNMSKGRIFIDYWNFQLNMVDFYGKEFRLDWFRLPNLLINQGAKLIGSPLEYEGMHVYISYDKNRDGDKSLKDWAHNVIEKVPGVDVIMKERKPRNPQKCPNCHREIKICPHCGKEIKAMVEKGVDTAIVTDLISLAWENSWEYAILVSSDKDYIPAVDMLNRKGFHVINAHFPPTGSDLAGNCWAEIDLKSCLKEIEFNKK